MNRPTSNSPTSLLATAFPRWERMALPFSRDQAMLGVAAINEFFLGLDIYLAHNLDGTIVPNEWIPILFGPLAGVALLVAGAIAQRRRQTATVMATVVLLASIVVGLLGAYFHFVRAILPTGPTGARVTIDLLVWGPPLLGPLTFSLVGILGISAAWREEPPNSGRLRLLHGVHLQLPYPKTQAYFFMVSMGTLATLLSSVLDHARASFENPWLWMPVLIGVFGTVTAAAMGAIRKHRRGDVWTHIVAMLLLLMVGVVGLILHVGENLTSEGAIVIERFLRGAPFLAPLLFANMGLLGLVTLLDSRERPRESR